MDGERPRPTRRRRIDGTILFGGILSALLHAIGIALLLMAPTRLQPLEPTAYSVEVVDPDALGGELLAGPIGGAAPAPAPAAPPEPEEPRVIAKAEPAIPPEPEAEAVALETVRPTPRPQPTAEATRKPQPTARATRRPRPTVTEIVAAAKRTPAARPAPEKTAARAPKRVAGATKPAKSAKPADGADAGGGSEQDLDSRLSAAIAGLEGNGAPGGGLGGAATSPTGPPGVGGQGPGGGGKVRGLEFVAYYTQMLARIKDRWTWPGSRSDLRVTVRFSILPSGDIANLRLVERSGEATYDASVQRAIKSASPFAPPPEAYRRDFADVELTFRPVDLEVSG